MSNRSPEENAIFRYWRSPCQSLLSAECNTSTCLASDLVAPVFVIFRASKFHLMVRLNPCVLARRSRKQYAITEHVFMCMYSRSLTRSSSTGKSQSSTAFRCRGCDGCIGVCPVPRLRHCIARTDDHERILSILGPTHSQLVGFLISIG